MFGKKNNLEKKIKLNISSKDLESDFKKRLLSQQSSSDLKGLEKVKLLWTLLKSTMETKSNNDLSWIKWATYFTKRFLKKTFL